MEISQRAPLLTRLIVGHFVLIMTIFHQTIDAKKKPHCPLSSCGNLQNIRHPFRLKSDPKKCGDSRYELSCENNVTVLYLFGYSDQNYYYKSYYVHAINYNNYTIRISDPDFQNENCASISVHSMNKNFFDMSPYEAYMKLKPIQNRVCYDRSAESLRIYRLTQNIIFLTCEKTVKKSHTYNYIERDPCPKNDSALSQSKRLYSYVVVGVDLNFSDLEESCRIDKVSLISTRRGSENLKKSSSYRDIHDELVHGFELSWLVSFRRRRLWEDTCYLDEDSNKVHCLSYCKDSESALEKIGTGFGKVNFYIRFYCQKLRIYFYIEMLLGPRLICTVFVISLLIYKWRTRHLSMYDGIEEFLRSNINLVPIRYSYWEIKEMSNGFKVKLGEGGFGSVYKGKDFSGHPVAIKMLGKSKANIQDFINEVATIGRIHHVNVGQLLGFCVEGSKRALIFDFMANGSLDKYIFSQEGINNLLSYETIHKISLGIAHGIEYLHQGCDMRILHFDIKPHNILLDENFIPKVSDFGLARFSSVDNSSVSLTAARGTIGYIAPELFYKNIGGVSSKADVYSFGMLLMEMANRRKNVNAHAENSSQIYFPLWIYDEFRKGKDIEIEDSTETELKTVKKMIIVALWCIQLKPCDRPSMNKVIEMLEGEVESLPMPPKPYLYPQEEEHEKHNIDDAKETSCSSSFSEEGGF